MSLARRKGERLQLVGQVKKTLYRAAIHTLDNDALLFHRPRAPSNHTNPNMANPKSAKVPLRLCVWLPGQDGDEQRVTLDWELAVAELPLYLDPERESQLGELRLPCSGTEASWLQAGAALFLSGGDA